MDTSYHQQLLEHTGKRIRFYRKLKKLSQDELATAIHKSESTLSKYERGSIAIDIATLHDIAEVLDVSIAELMDFNVPSTQKQTYNTGIWGQNSTLHIYYHNKHNKRFEHGVIQLLPPQNDDTYTKCRCYLDIPLSGEIFDCSYFFTGDVRYYDMVTYINMANSTMKMDHVCLYILNPCTRNAETWGLFVGIAYYEASVFVYKTLISPTPLSPNELDASRFQYTAEEIKQLKSKHMLPFTPLDKPGT